MCVCVCVYSIYSVLTAGEAASNRRKVCRVPWGTAERQPAAYSGDTTTRPAAFLQLRRANPRSSGVS